MAELISKIGDKFSDLFLDIELFFSGFKKSKQPETPVVGVSAKKTKEEITEKIQVKVKNASLSGRDLLFFFDQMETLVGAGVTLIDSLLILQAQTKKKSVKKLFAEMIHHINAGLSLAETMYLYPRVFPTMHSALIEAGEKSGNLKNVFAQIAEEMDSHMDFIRKIKGAMFYPVILLVLALGMVTGMMIFVIPRVAELYEQSNASLPALTAKVIGISEFVSAKYPIIFGTLIGFFVLLWLLVKKTRMGRLMWEKFVSIIPVFGQIDQQKNIMLFASNMGMLLQSGVLISDAFEIAEKTMPSLHYQRALGEIRHGIILGRNVSEMMGLEDIKAQKFTKNKLFPLQVAQMVHVGELTGGIAQMLMKIRQTYHKNIQYTLKNISTMIEPIMIFIVALLVGSILLAVMLPFFYIGTTIS